MPTTAGLVFSIIIAFVFAGYAAYAGWPWWSASLVGALSGFQIASTVLYQGTFRERIAAGDPSVTGQLAQASFVGACVGAASLTGCYFLVRWLTQ